MFLGLVLLIPPNPERSLEAVSVYEGLRLERIAQEEEEEETRREEKSSRNLLKEHTPSMLNSLKEHTPSFLNSLKEHTPSFQGFKVGRRQDCDPSVLARAGFPGRSTSPCDEPASKEAAGATGASHGGGGGDLAVEEIGSTSPELERTVLGHDKPRVRRVSNPNPDPNVYPLTPTLTPTLTLTLTRQARLARAADCRDLGLPRARG